MTSLFIEHTPEYFDALFRGNEDPWSFKSRWYEERKRALTLAALPARRYACAYEPGCANGELSAALAERCEQLLISDGASKAVELARARVAKLAHVQVIQAWVPREWPAQRFDLIVVSELAYFLDRPQIVELAIKVSGSLNPGGSVLACHWRAPIAGSECDGDEVTQILEQGLRLPRLTSIIDKDFNLNVWSSDARSVAQREGFA